MKPAPGSRACLMLAVWVLGWGTPDGMASLPEKEFAFPAHRVVDGQEMILNGTGLLRYKRILPVYDAALYLGAGIRPEDAMADVAKRIEVRYRVGADSSRFARAGDRILARTFTPEQIDPVRSRIDRINAWYPDPQPGDRCSITYLPGKGTELAFNGRAIGRIDGADFARVYFAIWLGPRPASKALRDALLSHATE